MNGWSLIEPTLGQILSFCEEDPVERVFLEDVARRGLGRFSALASNGKLTALCHVGANVVPSGVGCGAFGRAAASSRARMVIGEEHAVDELWAEAGAKMPTPREDRPGQPVYVLEEPPERGRHRPARGDARRPVAPRPGLRGRARGGDRHQPARPRPGRLPLAHAGADRRGPLLALARERHDPLQGGGLRLDARRRPAPAGLGRSLGAKPRLRAARDARPLPAPARAGAARVPVRAPGERAGDPRLRGRSGCGARSPTAR